MPALLDITSDWPTALLCAGLFLGGLLFASLYLIIPRSSIRHLQGPPVQSWFLGKDPYGERYVDR